MSISFEPKSTQFSLRNAYALALCSNLAYESEKNIHDQLSHFGFNATFIERRDTQAFIAYNDSAIVLAFRGTSSIQDWMTDSDLSLTSVRTGGKVHSGFFRALCLVWNDILQVITSVQTKAQPLWITGHSLGAALAALAAARFDLELDKPVSGVYTFGQPRVGDRDFARIVNADLNHRFYRFVNNSDVVTRIPTREPLSYSHIGSLRFFDADGHLFDDVSWWQEFLETVKGSLKDHLDLIPANIENHKIGRYIQNIKSNMPD